MHLYQDHSDPELTTLLTRGDKAAFEVIYRKYAPELYRYARRNISCKEDCEEMIQDVFESLWVRRSDLRIGSLRHYLFTSIRYLIIRYFRQKGVRQRYIAHFRLFEVLYDSMDGEEKSPEDVQAMLIRSLDGLPERCQLAIRLRIVENLSNNEIAERMNITRRTVELYMFKAFKHMRITYPDISNAGLS